MSAASARRSGVGPRRAHPLRADPRRFLRQGRAVAARDLALQRSYGSASLLGLASGLLGLASYHFIGRLVGPDALAGGSYFAFVCTGLAVQGVVAAGLGALGGALAREAHEGTLEPALAMGAPVSALLAGSVWVPALLAGAQGLLYLAAGAAWFPVDLAAARPGPALVALLLTLLACAPFGVLGAAAWLLVRRPGAVTTVAIFGLGFLGGVYFPVELLPGPLAAVSAWVPLTNGLDAVRGALLEGAGWRDTAPALLRLLGFAAVALPPSAGVLHAALEHARRRGSLGLV